MIKYVISSHLNPNLSGVAKFNFLLANKFNIPCIGMEKAFEIKNGPVLLSLKMKDLNHFEIEQFIKILLVFKNININYDIFFHTFDGMEIEYALIENCRQVFCGNSEINYSLQRINKPVISAWCPFLVDTHGIITESKLNLFSFGMAHKLQIKFYKMLYEMLQKHDLDYSLWVSTAFHEKANFGEFDMLSSQLSEIFGPHIQFLGFLSDEAINYFLGKTQLFVAFFEKGVRANNTTVNAAMVRGCAVLTNCDEYSPKWLIHGENILDIHKVRPEQLDVENLRKIGKMAQKDVNMYASWDGLTKLLSNHC